MNIAIMQPYFLPYIGYFQLINHVDKFVIYDEIQFTKKGWVHRNRMLMNNKDFMFSLSLKKDSDYLNIVDRQLSDNFKMDSLKLLRQIEGAYKKAKMFPQVFPEIEKILNYDNINLFHFIKYSLEVVCDYLDITTPIIVSSSLDFDNNLKAQDKVLTISKALHATEYTNPIGGVTLYDKTEFKSNGIDLSFLKANDIVYNQFQKEFIPFLSIIDLMMFNSTDKINEYLKNSFTIN